ncbi:NAD(P)H-binding protein [Nonomuraea sp. NPDC049709]|uniref:SDR family oxidoreductase n=1 Tax=Nonomuraea sp. NPDC049709 TaxID=3154736 RepID=UPI0034134F6B
MILVAGATAHFGRQAVESLVAAGHQVRALSRTPEAAGLPDGVEVVRGDLTQAATLAPALTGVTAVFLVLPYQMDPTAFLDAAREAGVGRIVFLSSGAVVEGADEQPDVIAAYHHGVERAIRANGAEWTFLRIFFPAINSLSFAMQLADGDVVRGPYAGAQSAPVHEGDVGEVAARVLTEDGHAGKVYELTGPESMTQAEQVSTLGRVLGRPLSFEELDPEPVRAQMGQFMDPAFINALFDLMAATVGKPAPVNSLVADLTGRPARGYAQWVADHVADFS